MDPFAEYISFILLSITLSVARARTAAGRNAPAHCHYYYYFFIFSLTFQTALLSIIRTASWLLLIDVAVGSLF